MDKDWKEYHQDTKTRSHSKLLEEALTHVRQKNSALDVGAGALVESKYLLSQGFKKVTAVDIVPFEQLSNPRFLFVQSSFEEYSFPREEFDIVNANFALPFCTPEHFSIVWSKMTSSMKKGAIFSGQLFGVRDAWSQDSSMTFHSNAQIQELLSNFEVLRYSEVEKEMPLSTSEMKHWHFYAIIFRKP